MAWGTQKTSNEVHNSNQSTLLGIIGMRNINDGGLGAHIKVLQTGNKKKCIVDRISSAAARATAASEGKSCAGAPVELSVYAS
eukprot:3067955-Pleurochrysis_carterae.AAC.4